jgi:photosystem II stability/assembly factor-like uncharacterized protein
MKKHILIFLFFVIATAGRGQWQQLNSGTNADLNDVQFINDSVGFVTGVAGAVLRTTDYGATWNSFVIDSATTWPTKDIAFPSAGVGYALAGNKIYTTLDQGVTWQQLPYVNSYDKTTIFFTDDTTGYFICAYGGCLKTVDGGLTWAPHNTGCFATVVMEDIYFVNADVGYTCGWYGDCFARTADGANTWQPYPGFATGSIVLSVFFPTPAVGYVSGSQGLGWIWKTLDSGSTWLPLNIDTLPAISSVYCTDVNTCYAVGGAGTIIKTTDGGFNWQQQVSGTTKSLREVFCIDANTCYAVGDTGVILKLDISTAVNSPAADNKFKIYPNPAHDGFTLTFSKPCEGSIKIFDLTGRVVHKQPISNNPSSYINSSFSPGVYFVKVTSGEREEVQKLVVQ